MPSGGMASGGFVGGESTGAPLLHRQAASVLIVPRKPRLALQVGESVMYLACCRFCIDPASPGHGRLFGTTKGLGIARMHVAMDHGQPVAGHDGGRGDVCLEEGQKGSRG